MKKIVQYNCGCSIGPLPEDRILEYCEKHGESVQREYQVPKNGTYPKKVRACDVVNSNFAPGLFMLEGGQAKYDEVYKRDGGNAFYLTRIDAVDKGLKVTKRWIPWNATVIQMFEMKAVGEA